MRHIVNGTPVVLGAALIVPAGLMNKLRGRNLSTSLRHSPKRNYCRSPLSSAGFGGLIQTAVGGSAGRGSRRTNRSGCAA